MDCVWQAYGKRHDASTALGVRAGYYLVSNLEMAAEEKHRLAVSIFPEKSRALNVFSRFVHSYSGEVINQPHLRGENFARVGAFSDLGFMRA
jgi:hypothetical protein